MSKNIIETDVFDKRRLQCIYTKLSEKIESVEKNPWPTLQTADDEIRRLRKIIKDAYAVIKPEVHFVKDTDPIDQYSLRRYTMSKVDEIEKILRKGLD
jgi:hypothetical protein